MSFESPPRSFESQNGSNTNVHEGAEIQLLDGCHYQWRGADQVLITIAKIANNRPLGDLSGTLAVELWPNSEPYDGTPLVGSPLAHTTIGELQGQYCLTDCSYLLNLLSAVNPLEHLAVVVREWTAEGFVTKDFVNFPPQAVRTQTDLDASGNADLVSVNQATENQLRAVKGINKDLAKALVAARPFSKMKSLRDVAGVDKKKYKKLQKRLCL